MKNTFILFIILVFLSMLSPLFSGAANPTAFTLDDTIRVSGRTAETNFDPVIACKYQIDYPSGAITTFKVSTARIPVPLGAETVTLVIQSSLSNPNNKADPYIQSPTNDICVTLASKSAVVGATPYLIAPSIPSSATRCIFSEGTYTFPVQAAGEVVLSISAAWDARVSGTTGTRKKISLDLGFNVNQYQRRN